MLRTATMVAPMLTYAFSHGSLGHFCFWVNVMQAEVAKATAALGAQEKDQRALSKALREQFSDAYQCRRCDFGPVVHQACSDLRAHHGQQVGSNSKISNTCPKCGWFSARLAEWPRWNGKVAWQGKIA